MSEKDNTVKLIGVTPVRNKKGQYLATQIFDQIKNNLEIEENIIKEKISGMAGDGAF